MLTNERLISVIIPVYNGSRYLHNCYRCLKEQTYSNLEIIFVDDGSKDNSLELLQEYSVEDSRIVIIHQDNKGVSAARNIGMAQAKGEYISFFDVDDIIHSDFFEKMLQDAISSNADIICGGGMSFIQMKIA